MGESNAFYEAVKAKQVRKIRIMLKDSLLVDPTFKEFKELEKAASSVEGLYDVHDGRPFEENPELWSDAYMDKIMVQVVGNFSRERVEHLKKVVRKLRPVSEESVKASARKGTSSGRTWKSNAQGQRDNTNESKIIAGAVVGGAVCCAVGALAASSAAVGAAVGAVGGAVVGAGIAAYCSNNERK